MNLSKFQMAGNLFNFEYCFQNLKNSIFVSMTTMEATLVLGLFQLRILKKILLSCILCVKCIPVEVEV